MRETFLILAAAVIAFGGALWTPFHLDDFALLQDPTVTSPDGWRAAWGLLQTRPLTWLTFWLNYQTGGGVAAFHAVNLLLHLACVVLVRTVLTRLIPARAAVIGAAIFALHPLQTETVVYVFDRATLLMTLFCLLALMDWTGGRHWRAAAWFIPALLSKEECVSFPLFLLLLHFSTSGNRKELRAIVVMLALALLAGVRVLYASTAIAGSGAGAQAGISPGAYFLTQGVALWRYLRLLILPYGFSIESPLEPASLIIGVLAWGGIAALLLAAVRRIHTKEGFWAIAAFLLIAPSSTVLPAADLSADRRMYLPMVAIGALAGLLLASRPRWIAISLVAALGLISLRQTLVWRSGETLWREAMLLAPKKVRPRIQLARYAPPAEALAILNAAQAVAPGDPAVASEKGRVYIDLNNPAAALGEFGRALALAPQDARAVNNRGVALMRLNQRDAAIADFRRALTIDRCLFDAWRNLRAAGIVETPPSDCRYTPEQKEALR